MAQTTLDSTNIGEFLTTGKVTPKEEPKPAETKSDTSQKADEKPAEKSADDDEVPLSEKQQAKMEKLIAKKHRQMREAEERAVSDGAARRAAEDRAEQLQAQIDELKSKQAPTREEPKRPDRADFKTDAEYWEAMIDFKADAKVRENEARRNAEEAQRRAQEAEEAYLARVKQSAKEIPDYDTQIQEAIAEHDVDVALPIASYVRESDSPAHFLLYFAQNPDFVEHLNTLPTSKAYRQLAKLELTFTKAEKTDKTVDPPVKADSKPDKPRAPEPITPVNGGSAPVVKDMKDWTVADHKAAVDKQRANSAFRRARH